jgi:uncharacterized protein (TIRG00374 family)
VRNRLKILAGALLGLALIYWFVRDLDGRAVLETIGRANWWLLGAATALTMSTFVIRAVRWRALLEPVSPGVRVGPLFAATSVGFAAVFLMGRTGEIVRPVALSSREHIRPSASFATILVERIFDMVTAVAFFSVPLVVFTAPRADAETVTLIRWAGATLLAVAAGSIVGLVFLYRHRVGAVAFLDRALRPFGRRVRKGVTSVVGHFAESLSILHDWRELVVVAGWSVLLWLVCALVNALTFSAFGLDVSFLGAIFVMGFSLVGSLVPTPGGAAGAFHLSTAQGLKLLGTGDTEADSIAIVLHLIVFGSALPLGLYFVMRGGYSLSRLRDALSEDLNSMPDFAADVGYDPAIDGLPRHEKVEADR